MRNKDLSCLIHRFGKHVCINLANKIKRGQKKKKCKKPTTKEADRDKNMTINQFICGAVTRPSSGDG